MGYADTSNFNLADISIGAFRRAVVFNPTFDVTLRHLQGALADTFCSYEHVRCGIWLNVPVDR